MVKEKKEILDHKTHSKILACMAVAEYDNSSESYSADIAKKLNYHRANVEKHLNVLEKNSYVVLNKTLTPQIKNKKYYSINWPRLSEDFFYFIKNKTKGFASKDFNFFNKKALFKNPYFIELIKSSFYNNFKKNNSQLKTINEMFEEIFTQMIFYLPIHESDDIEKLSNKDAYAKEIILISQKINDYIIKNQYSVLDEFYERISRKRKLMNDGTPKKNK